MKVTRRDVSTPPLFQPVEIVFLCESEKELQALSLLFNHCWILDAVKEATGVDLFLTQIYSQVNEATGHVYRDTNFNKIIGRIFKERQ